VLVVLILSSGCFQTNYKKLVDNGLKAFDNKDYQQAKESFEKACDGGNADGCSLYKALNEQGVK
jgi:hypothetical protein